MTVTARRDHTNESEKYITFSFDRKVFREEWKETSSKPLFGALECIQQQFKVIVLEKKISAIDYAINCLI